jgi:hypothetical protein
VSEDEVRFLICGYESPDNEPLNKGENKMKKVKSVKKRPEPKDPTISDERPMWVTDPDAKPTTDWIFYEGQAEELFKHANFNGVAARSITLVDIKWWAGERNLDEGTLKTAVENTKYKWNDNFNR